MRRLLGVLREADARPALAPQPGLAHLDAAASTKVRDAGLPVELTVEGRPGRCRRGSTSRPTASCRRR